MAIWEFKLSAAISRAAGYFFEIRTRQRHVDGNIVFFPLLCKQRAQPADVGSILTI